MQKAIREAVDDVAADAIAFTPTVTFLRETKLVGDRVYLFVLLADAAGKRRSQVLKAASARPGPDRR